MSGICNDGSDLILTAKDLQKWVDTFSTWLNGDETTFVVLGDKEVPSIRNLVAMIDERESNAAQIAIDGGMQQIVLARNQVIQMRDAIYRMFSEMDATTATAETLPPEAAATAHWDTERRILSLGIPQGRKGDKGDVGPRGYPPIVDVISCGGSEDVWLTIIEGGNSVTPEDEFHYPDPPTEPDNPDQPDVPPVEPPEDEKKTPLWDFNQLQYLVPDFQKYGNDGMIWYRIVPSEDGIAFVGVVGNNSASSEDVLIVQCGGRTVITEGLRRMNNIYPVFVQRNVPVRVGVPQLAAANPQFWFAPYMDYGDAFYNELGELGMKVDWGNPMEVSLNPNSVGIDTGYEEYIGASPVTGLMVVKTSGRDDIEPGQSLIQVLLNNTTALATGLRVGDNAFLIPVNANAEIRIRRSNLASGQTATVYPYFLPGYVGKKYVIQSGMGLQCGEGYQCGQGVTEFGPDAPNTPTPTNTANNG